MRTHIRIATTAALAVFTLTALASLAQGDDRRSKPVKADLDTLKAELRPCQDGWMLRVRYEVDVKRARTGDRFQLVATLRERGAAVLDGAGRPIRLVIPLDAPTRCKQDERKFEGGIDLVISDSAVLRPDRLRVSGVVVTGRESVELDCKSSSVKLRDCRVVVQRSGAIGVEVFTRRVHVGVHAGW